MGYRREIDSPFRLTPAEAKLLELLDGGMNVKEALIALGHKPKQKPGSPVLYATACEKRRLLLLQEQSGKKAGVSSLSKARGQVRIVGTK